MTLDATAPRFSGDAQLREWFGRMERLAVGPAAVEPAMRVIGDTDVRDILPLIRVPTLVTRREGDDADRPPPREFVRDHVPGARFVELPGTESILFLDDTEPLVDELEELVTGHARDPPARARARHRPVHRHRRLDRARVGGRRPRRGASSSTPITRSSAPSSRAHGGEEVKTMGDGFLATFDGPARAVRCALRVAERSGGAGVPVRAGIHIGECERVGSDVAGIAVHIAARVMGEAGARRGARVAHRHAISWRARACASPRAARRRCAGCPASGSC